MRKVILASVLLIPLAACVTAKQVEDKIGQVQSYTKLACSFVPTVATVAKIFATGAAVDSASAVADAICNAVTNRPLADGPGDRVPRAYGVEVKGKFVK